MRACKWAVIGLFIHFLPLQLFADTVLVRDGVADLRHLDLHAAEFKLSGDWEFFWRQLLFPEDLAAAGPGQLVPFPQRWNELLADFPEISPLGYGTYKLLVLVPPGSSTLGLDVPDVYTSYCLFINGDLVSSNGEPNVNKQTTKPRWLGKTIPLPAHADTLELVLQIANFHHSKGGPYKDVVIGSFEKLSYQRKRNSALDLLVSGAMLMGSLFFFGFYIIGKYDRVMLFFSLFCLTYSYRPGGSRLYILHDIFSQYSWLISIRVEYFSLFAAIGFFAAYTYYLYPKEANRNLLFGLAGLSLLLGVSTWILSPYYFTQVLSPFLILMFAALAYITYVYLKAVHNKRIGSSYALASTMLILVVMLLINLEYFQLLFPAAVLINLGYLIFLCLQSIVLALRFSNILDGARKQALQGLLAKTAFMSTMSHEIRTPLNVVIGMSHLLLENNPRPDQQDQINVMLFSSKNLLNIVNDILDYNKMEDGKIALEKLPIDFEGMLRNIIYGLKAQASEKGLEIRFTSDESLKLKLLADPTRLTQVIINLVQNAIKFTSEGWVEVRMLEMTRNASRVRLRIEVEDTGIGIAPGKLGVIFERFTQADSSTSRSYGGTGLGLTIARRILQLYKSDLQVKSRLDEGSTFWFDLELPIADQSAEIPDELMARKEQKRSKSRVLEGASILLVEDNLLNIKVATTFLQQWGATVDLAMNGQEALEKFDAKRHQLVLMDLHMPVMDGYVATKKLREAGVTLPIVALTASLAHEVEHDAFKAGFNTLVLKPFDPEDLKAVLWQQIKSTAKYKGT